MSSAVIFGAAALGAVDQATADGVLDLLFEYGVNHIDTAPRYGEAELRIGPWMDKHRKDFFLATKTGARDYVGAKEEIHRSLDRLRTDHIDLLQMHALVYPDECRQVFAAGGALEALVEAREQGLVKYLGITGHGWTVAAMHQQSLEKFDFDSILMPWNWFAANHALYRPDYDATLALCKQRNVAVQTIKGIARGPWAAGVTPNRTTWYQPMENEAAIRTSVHWVLGHPDIFLNSAGDVSLLPAIFKAASELGSQPSDAAMAALRAEEGMASIFGI
ncbi:MAG: aldo/keto reductase [Rhodospirillales bacterium]|nr:aldo/keto reductase [Rhodospirillales bacterium]